ncbi:hypothetical protein A9Q84_13600 [Halobacteriovorax marinus]|uniref:Ankyrin repeat domain-containing protein n=1 Tax=Halobacteriovorax marinus TaxID=97084 RepID=A0A1Y5F986_9BACT|nr:hypothetical protein A9Q84_13600 [Halobacteriovorax marinus]
MNMKSILILIIFMLTGLSHAESGVTAATRSMIKIACEKDLTVLLKVTLKNDTKENVKKIVIESTNCLNKAINNLEFFNLLKTIFSDEEMSNLNNYNDPRFAFYDACTMKSYNEAIYNTVCFSNLKKGKEPWFDVAPARDDYYFWRIFDDSVASRKTIKILKELGNFPLFIPNDWNGEGEILLPSVMAAYQYGLIHSSTPRTPTYINLINTTENIDAFVLFKGYGDTTPKIRTLISMATRNNDYTTIEEVKLIYRERGLSEVETSPILEALKKLDVKTAINLINEGHDINVFDKDGLTIQGFILLENSRKFRDSLKGLSKAYEIVVELDDWF